MSASWILHINAFHTCPIEAWETAGFHSSQTLQQLAPLINTNATKAEELNGEMSYSSILGEAKYWESSALEPNGRKKKKKSYFSDNHEFHSGSFRGRSHYEITCRSIIIDLLIMFLFSSLWNEFQFIVGLVDIIPIQVCWKSAGV